VVWGAGDERGGVYDDGERHHEPGADIGNDGVERVGHRDGGQGLTVTSIVQEIVNQGGWASGNAMALLLYGVASCAIQITSYDTSTTLCARLAIDYTEGGGGGGGITMHAMYYARVREG
jgi:hypothetical protein